METPLIPEDAVFPDDESRKMAEEVAKDIAAKEAKEAAPQKADDKEPQEDSQEDSQKEPAPDKEPDKTEEEPEPKKKVEEPEEEGDGKPGTVPAWQFRAFQKQMGKKFEQLTELVQTALKPTATPEEKQEAVEQTEVVDDALKAFAEKHGWDMDMLVEMRKALGTATLPPEIKEVAEQAKRDKAVQEQETGFKNELAEAIESDPNLKGIDKEKLHELAFSDQFKSYRLTDIIALNKSVLIPSESKGKKTFESPRGGSRHDDSVDLTQEQPAEVLAKLTPKQFEEYSENMAKVSKGTLMRNGSPVSK